MAGTEMRGVVDEPDDPINSGVQKPEVDWDKRCSYLTYKIVTIRDWKLGLLYWGVVTLVVMYIIVVNFALEGRQAVRSSGLGTVVVRFKGKAFANGKVYDEADLRFPPIEPAGAFIMTKRVMMKNQKVGRCADEDIPRVCPCADGATCFDGLCEMDGWCPSIGDHNANATPVGSIVESFTGVENGVFQIIMSITFADLDNTIYVAKDAEESGATRLKNVTFLELLEMAEPKLKLEDVMEHGALISISASWTCDVNIPYCEPAMSIKSMDDGAGFVQKRARRHRGSDGSELRDAMYMYGLRVVVDSQGVGRKTLLSLIVVQLGACIALLRTASMVADFMMLKLYDEERRKAYYRCKVIETRDYSDLQDRINLIQDQGKPQPSLLGMSGSTSSGLQRRAGSRGDLGLGRGARGGMASTMLSGRQAS